MNLRRRVALGAIVAGQLADQPLRKHRQPRQLLADAVVKVLADAPLFERRDLEDLALQCLAFGDVPRDGRCTEHFAGRALDRRDAERDVDLSAILADARGLEVRNMQAAPDALEAAKNI